MPAAGREPQVDELGGDIGVVERTVRPCEEVDRVGESTRARKLPRFLARGNGIERVAQVGIGTTSPRHLG